MITKVCTSCMEEKKLSEFGNYFSQERNKVRYKSYCKKCEAKKAREFRKSNSDNPEYKNRRAIYAKRFFIKVSKDPEFRLKCKLRLEQWRKNNPEKYKAQKKRSDTKYYIGHKDYIGQQTKKWRQKNYQKVTLIKKNWEHRNREKYYMSVQKKNNIRHAAERTGNVTTEYLLWLEKKIGNICPYCGLEMRIKHLDHIVPLKKGGTHTVGNVIYCCMTCNLKKHSKSLEGFNGMKLEDLQSIINYNG